MKQKQTSVRNIFLIFILFSFILSLSIIIIEEVFFTGNAQKVALDNATKKIDEREQTLKDFLNDSERVLVSIKESNFFKNFYNKGGDKHLLEDLFLTYAKSNSDFMQIRYLDQNGNEVVRIDRDERGSAPVIVPQEKLQNKADRYYFKYAKTTESEKVWFSAIDLNQEHGKIQIPYVPTLRAVLPIKRDDKFNGLIIINYFMEDFLKKLSNAPLYDMTLFNDEGYTVFHSQGEDHSKCWGNSLQHKYNISDEFPNSYQEITSNSFLKTDTFISRKMSLPVYGGLNLILQMNNNYLLDQQKRSKIHYATISLIVFLLSIVITYLIIKIFSKTLFNIDKLNRLNESLNEASKVAKIGFWEFDALTQKISWSDGVYNIFELEDKNVKVDYALFLSYLPEEDSEALQKEFAASIEEMREYFVTHKIITEKGTIKYVQERAHHTYDEDGELVKSIGSIYDITEKYLSERKFKLLLDYASDGVHILDLDGNVINFSHSFADALGYTIEEARNLNINDWDVGLTSDELAEIKKKLSNIALTFETKHKRKDGTIIDVEIHAKMIELESKRYYYASLRDITKAKESERLLLKKTAEQEALLSLFDISDSILFRWNNDEQWSVDYVSDNVEKLLGYTKEEFLSSKIKYADCVHKDDIQRVLKEVKHGINSADGYFKHDLYRLITKDKKELWIYDQTIVERDEEGNVTYFIGYILDVTKEKNDEQLLKEQHAELEAIFSTALEGIALLDLDLKYTFFNQQYANMLEYEEEELRGKYCDDITVPEYLEESKEIYKKVLENGYYENFERVCVTKSGKNKRLSSSIALMPNKKNFLMTTVDHTELYEAMELIKKQSYIDELTQLSNRKSYNQKIEELMAQFERYDTTFSMLMFDIDYFKSVNDTYGHNVGDKVLVELSQIVSSMLRKSDFIFRVGGEEFVILLTHTNSKNAVTFAEKLRTTIQADVKVLKEYDRDITVSIGLTEVCDIDTIESIYKRSDEALYEAKNSGRNIVVTK